MASAAEVTPADIIMRSARSALELLSSMGRKQYQGIHQAAKDLGHWLSPRSRRRLRVLVESAPLLRHATSYSVAAFHGDVRVEITTQGSQQAPSQVYQGVLRAKVGA